jgi:hypothetical protein
MLLQDIQREKNETKGFTFKQKLLQSVSGFVRGPAQSFLQANFGWLGGGLSALGFLAVSATANYLGFSREKHELLNNYRDELALLLRKDREAVTFEDLESYASKASPSVSPIADDYAIICRNERATQLKSLLKNALISTSVIAFAVFAPQSLVIGMMGYAIVGAIALAIDVTAEDKFGKWTAEQRQTGSRFVRGIQSEMARGPISAERLFDYTAQARPAIVASVKNTLHEDYATLSFEKKQMVMQQLGVAESMKQIAADLNHGIIRPSELPFLLVGMDSPSTPIRKYTGKLTAPIPATEREMAPAPLAPPTQPETLVHTPQLESTVARQPAQALAT